MTANIVRFPGPDMPTAFPSRAPSARCQWEGCRARGWYALEITALGDGPTEVLCVRHLDLALQQSSIAPGDLLIQPLVVDRTIWPVARFVWRRARMRRLQAAIDTALADSEMMTA